MELPDLDKAACEDLQRVLKRHPHLKQLKMDTAPVFTFHQLEIDTGRYTVRYNGQKIPLTPKEYALLCLLVLNAGTVLTYRQLYETVWGEDALGNASNAVCCHIYNIRKKFHHISKKLSFTFRCVRETGYCFEDREE